MLQAGVAGGHVKLHSDWIHGVILTLPTLVRDFNPVGNEYVGNFSPTTLSRNYSSNYLLVSRELSAPPVI